MKYIVMVRLIGDGQSSDVQDFPLASFASQKKAEEFDTKVMNAIAKISTGQSKDNKEKSLARKKVIMAITGEPDTYYKPDSTYIIHSDNDANEKALDAALAAFEALK